MTSDLHYLSATRLTELLRERAISSVEVCEAHIARISEVNPVVNAMVEVATTSALRDAAALDALPPGERGPLQGLPFAVKDLQDARGLLSTRGSLAWSDMRAEHDDPWVAQVRAVGGVVLGKTNTPELGTKPHTTNRVYGPTRNPWSPQYGVGGSSGGAAAAVSAGMVPLAQGSDTAGSCRMPASCCGVVGIKTSRGLVRMGEGAGGFGHLDAIGPLARSVEDAALFLDALADPDETGAPAGDAGFLEAARREPGTMRLAFAHPVAGERSAEVDTVFASALERLSAMGHELEEIDLPFVAMQQPWTTIVLVLIADLAEQFSAQELSRLEPGNLATMIRGAAIRGVEYVQALARASELARDVLQRLEPFDALVTPTLTLPPYAVDRLTPESDADDMFQALFDWGEFMLPVNVTGQPGISVPGGFTTEGLPVGVHIVGPPRGEATILPLAAAFERASIAEGVPVVPPLGAETPAPSIAGV